MTIKIFKPYKGSVYKITLDIEDFIKFNSKGININTTGKNYLNAIWGKTNANVLPRLILACPKGMTVDHIDRNTLNNIKSNLRICTHAENSLNRGPKKNSASKYKGVSLEKRKRPKQWRAKLVIGETTLRASFSTEIEAAIQYNSWVKELCPEYGFLNDV